MPSFLSPILRDPTRKFTLVNGRTGATLAREIIPAFDRGTRNRGLLSHDSLPSGTAIILAPTFAVHTFFMKFPIDVLFVAKDGTVHKVRRAVPPGRVAACWRAFATIELVSGRLDVIAGDRVGLA
jgi:uncharacterized protein